MYYTIYKTTNLLNNKYYIGKHQTQNPNDGYFGSGKAIVNAIKLHGKHNFKKEVLFIFDNEADMNAKEKEILTEEFINTELNYNMGVGGEGGPHFKGRKHTEDTKKLIGKLSRQHIMSVEARAKISEAIRKRGPCSTEVKEKISLALKGRKMSEEQKRKISESVKIQRAGQVR